MNSLFSTDEDDTQLECPVELATAEQVRELEGFGRLKEAVRRWTREKAAAVLADCKREQQIALRRAASVALAQSGDAARGQPSTIERVTAAVFLEQAMGEGADELVQAVAYTVWVLTDAELKRLAGYLVRVYRSERQ